MPETNVINQDIHDRDLLLRQSRLLYPDVEDWVLEMAIEAYVTELGSQEPKMEEIN